MTVQESVEIVEQVALPPPNCTNASSLPPSLLLPNASSWLSSHTIIPARLPVASSWQNCVKPASSCHTPVLSLLPGFYFASSSSTTLSNHDGTWLSLLTLTFTMLAQLFDVGYFLHLAPSGELGCLTTPPQTSRKCVLSLAGQHCINTSTAHNFYASLPLHQFTPAHQTVSLARRQELQVWWLRWCALHQLPRPNFRLGRELCNRRGEPADLKGLGRQLGQI